MKVTMLGCGPSWGVPWIGGDWGACDPTNPKNRRRRVSILVEERGKTILIDTSPDLREQLLDAGVRRIDAVLFTHAHADHLHGIDDLRGVNHVMKAPVPIYGTRETLADIERRFGYVFTPLKPGAEGRYYKPVLERHAIDGPFEAAGIAVTPFVQEHGFSKTLGFRFGGFAYSTDVIALDAAAFRALAGIDTWVVDCIRRAPHVTHSHVDRTLEWIARVRPRRAVLTHMDESLDYETLRRALPDGVEPGYDGMVIEL
ncbi:MAG: MBL fold metallo-hydrolase [Alphaproteobacteria bacterium]|nr:MBL fold metallo-hydrolase [Alphaproteobacteria bacterium]